MTIECAPTSRWYGLLLALTGIVLMGGGVLFTFGYGLDGVAVVMGSLSLVFGGAMLVMIGRACLTHVTITATPDSLTLHASAYFRGPVTIPREEIYGVFFGTRPLIGPASSRHSALLISLPRTNLGIRFNNDHCIAEARPLWSTLINDVWLKFGGKSNNSTPVPSPTTPTRGILVRVDHPEATAQALASLMNVDTGAIW